MSDTIEISVYGGGKLTVLKEYAAIVMPHVWYPVTFSTSEHPLAQYFTYISGRPVTMHGLIREQTAPPPETASPAYR